MYKMMEIIDIIIIPSATFNIVEFLWYLSLSIILMLWFVSLFLDINSANVGTQGYQGYQGYQGDNGGLQVCGKKYQTVEEKKTYEKALNYLDMKSPLIVTD